jgi:hypothetical protein
MANILESPITLGAIQGILDTAVQSRLAIRKQKKLEEKAAAEAKKSAQGDLFSFLTNKDNYGLANAYMQNGENLATFMGFQPEQQQAIFLNAHRTDQPLPANQKTVFDTIMSDQVLAGETMSTYSKYVNKGVFPAMQKYSEISGRSYGDFTTDDFLDIGLQVGMEIDADELRLVNTISSLPSSYITMMQAFATQDKMTANELSMFNALPEDPRKKVAEARNLLTAARPGSKFETLLTSVIRTPIPEKPYERISNDERDDLAALFTGKDGALESEIIAPALETVNALRNTIVEKHLKKITDDNGNVSYSGPRGAILDVMFLDGIASKYGTADSLLAGKETVSDIIKMLDDGVQNLSKFSEDDVGAKKQSAKNVLENIAAFVGDPGVLKDADTGTPGFQVSPSIPAKAHADFLALINARDLVEKVAKDVYSFTSSDKTINIETGKTLEEDPTGFLQQLNTRIASISYGVTNTQGQPRTPGDNGLDFYTAMTVEEKQEFEAQVTSALKLDYALQMQASYRGEEKREAPGPRDYAYAFGELYSLPFVQTLVHDVFKQPRPDETRSGLLTNSTPQVDTSGAELSEDQYALTPTTVLRVTPAVKSLAAKRGVSTHAFFNNSDLNFRMIEASNYDNPFYLFEAANVISDMGFFSTRRDAPLRERDAASIGQVLARFGITDRNDQLDVLSVAMSADLPPGFALQSGRTTMTLAETNRMFSRLTGSSISDKKLDERRRADADFLKQGNLVLNLLEQQPLGSQFTTDVRVKFANLFLIDDSVAKQAFQAGGKALEALGLYNPDDYESQAQRERIETATASFLQQEFLKNDAQLASALVKFAYNFAKTMDEAGRISERDYIAALKAVNADFLSSKEARITVVEGLLQETKDAIVRHNQIFDLKTSMQQGQRYFAPTRSQIQQMRALRYFGNLVQVTSGLDDVEEFKKDFANTGATSITAIGVNPAFSGFREKYDVKYADDVFGPSATQPGTYVYRVRKKIFGDSVPVDFIRGVPLYINAQGEFLSQDEIRARTVQQ